MSGRFIVFEGIDGAGKTTQLNRLYKDLTAKGYDIQITQEPSSGPCGILIRQALRGDINLDAATLALLFAADRTDHIEHIKKALEAGKTVLCDRYLLSSIAYNSDVLSADWILQINDVARRALLPDLTILFDLPVDDALARIDRRGDKKERFEEKEKLQRIREHYLHWAKELPERILVIDGSDTSDAISRQLTDLIDPYL